MTSEIARYFLERKPLLEAEMGEEIAVAGLVGPYRIFQRAHGHRHSIDDATTSWYALQKSPNVDRVLDLGTGVGTVGLSVLWGLGDDARLTCIEAQEVSYKLLCENIKGNGLTERVTPIHDDIRNVSLGETFPLVTGSPPYFPLGTGVLPIDSQKAHARFELRGDVGDYAKAAKRHLAPGGLFVFCFPFQQKSRCIKLVTEAGFGILTIKDVVPMKSKAALFSLYTAQLDVKGTTVEEPALIVAHENGKYTDEMLALQATRGFGPEGTNDR